MQTLQQLQQMHIGLTGTPNISVGIITATQYVGVPEGTNVLKAMLFV